MESKSTIKIFSKFLDSNQVKVEDLKNVNDILKLPIYSCKYLNKKEAKILEELLEIVDIEDASQLNKDDPFGTLIELKKTDDPIKESLMKEKLRKKISELKEKYPNIESNLKKTITISSLIKDIQDEDKKLDKKTQKVIVVGLDNAGKTAILKKFGGKLGINEIASLKPTKGVHRELIEGQKLDLYIWDFGGQAEYRDKYLNNPEKYFLQIDLLIYVIDVQDTDKFEESLKYFNEILNILITLEENPYILIFIHKMDPDIKGDSTVQLSVELLKDSIEDLFNEVPFDSEIYLTSIYSLISNEPQFARYLKEIMKSNYSLTDPTVKKLEGFAKVLEENMNLVIRLSESLSQQLNEIDNRLRAIESGAFSLAQAGIPIEIKTSEQIKESREIKEENVRSKVLGELKELFQKKRSLEP